MQLGNCNQVGLVAAIHTLGRHQPALQGCKLTHASAPEHGQRNTSTVFQERRYAMIDNQNERLGWAWWWRPLPQTVSTSALFNGD